MANISPDIAMRVAVGETAAANVPDKAGVVPSGHVSKEVADIRAQIVKKKGESPAATLSESLTARDRSLPELRSDVVINRNIGAESIDPKTAIKKRLPAENDRLREAVSADQTIRDVLKDRTIRPITDSEWKGLGGIKRFEELRKTLDQIIDDSEWAYLNVDQRIQLYNDILGDQKFLASIREKYGEALEVKVEGDDIAEAQRQEAAAKARLDAVKLREKTTGKKLADLKKRDQQLSTGSTHPDYVDYSRLKTADLPNKTRDAKRELDDANAEYEDLRRARIKGTTAIGGTDINTLISTALGERSRKQGVYDGFLADKEKLDRLEAEISSLPAKIEQANQEKADIDAEKSEAQGAYDMASVALTESRSRRADSEDVFVQKLRTVVRDGIAARIDENRQLAQQASETVMEKRKKEATSAAEKAVYDWFEKKLFMPNPNRGRFRNKSINVPNKAEIGNLYARLMSLKDGGPDLILTRAMNDIKIMNPTTGRLEALTDEQKAQFLENSELTSKMKNDFAEQVMKMHFNTGGKITAQDAAFISTKPWGQGLIDRALESSGVKEWEEKLAAAGVLDKDKKLRGLIFSKKGLAAGGLIALLLTMAMGGALPAGMLTGAGGLVLSGAQGAGENLGKLI